jgi:hypothetical protein
MCAGRSRVLMEGAQRRRNETFEETETKTLTKAEVEAETLINPDDGLHNRSGADDRRKRDEGRDEGGGSDNAERSDYRN